MIRRLLAMCMVALVAGLLLALPAGAQGPALPEGLRAEPPATATGRLDLILRRGTLIVGVKADYPPWGKVDDAGDLVGLEPDLAADMAARLGVGLKLVPVTSSNRIGRVNDGIVDVVIATAGDTEKRRSQADLILPNYYSSGVVVYSRADQGLTSWDDVRDARLCLNRGAFFNRSLEQDYGIIGMYFSGSRESRLALLQGRCVGWAYDDTALTQLIQENARQRADMPLGDGAASVTYHVSNDAILVTPWSVIVAKGEGAAPLGVFVADMIAEWHGRGFVGELQDKWGIQRSAFIADKQALWSAVDARGRALCARGADGAFPARCLESDPFRAEELPSPDWMVRLDGATGIDLTAFADPVNRARLAQGLWLTLVLSVSAIAGALTVAIALTALYGVLGKLGRLGQVLLLPQRALVTVARMTPPILQLYIVFFGLGGSFTAAFNYTPSNLMIAAVILSVYAGATNTVILNHAYDQDVALHPERGISGHLKAALVRGFDGLVAACVNIVKAAGMASAIAVSEVISTINLIVAEGADTKTMMNGLLVFYFLLVLAILWLFRAARRVIVERA